MARYKLLLEYAGTRYSGWQIQKNARTVQGELHAALRTLVPRGHLETYGAGRTDAGVHALGQVAHVDTALELAPGRLVSRVNDALPYDINVLAAERVSPRFHARHSALARSYVYQIARRRTAFAKPFVWWVREPLNAAAMQQAAQTFEGFADFRAFTDDDPEEKSTEVLVQQVALVEAGSLVLLRVVGSHFLWKMVRRLTGVLVGVGRGDLRPADVTRLLSSTSDLPAKLTAPASGLFLERVVYDEAAAGALAEPLVPPLFRLDRPERGHNPVHERADLKAPDRGPRERPGRR